MSRVVLPLAFGLAVGLALPSTGLAQAPAMPDPKVMSGIPRADPQVPPGTVTVRCLNGTFAEPAVGVEVTLELKSADGATTETRSATTVAQGRATFDGLSAFTGGSATARVTLGGAEVRSRPIPLVPQAGSRVLLVKGAGSPSAGAPSMGGPPAGPAAAGGGAPHGLSLREGVPFDLPDRKAGELVVGIVEPVGGGPVPQADREVKLEITIPGQAKPRIEVRRTDEQGRALFSDLAPPQLPEGATIKVVASVKDGEEPRSSDPFRMGDAAKAMIFTVSGSLDRAMAAERAAPPPAAPARPELPPRRVSDLAPDVVRVRVVGPDAKPVTEQPVTVMRQDMTGRKVRVEGITDAEGTVELEVALADDAFFFAATTFGGAPYQSAFFDMDGNRGVEAPLRVFPTTSDRSRVRSAVQFEVRELENDLVQIIQVYEVFVEGDAAFWPRGGMRMYGAKGARGLQVLPRAKKWLESKDSAPFVELVEPLAPGEVARLSIAYVVDHDGGAKIEWLAPFPVQQAMMVLDDEFTLVSGAGGPAETAPHVSGEGTVEFQPLTVPEFKRGPCEAVRAGDVDSCPPLLEAFSGTPVSFEIAGLKSTAHWDEWVGVGGGVALGTLILVALLVRRRKSPREVLVEQREVLVGALRSLNASGLAPEELKAERQRLTEALDGVVRKLEALETA